MISDDLEREMGLARAAVQRALRTVEDERTNPSNREQDMETHGNGQRMAEVVRGNSVPLALMGLGLGWLVLSSVRSGASNRKQGNAGEAYGAAEGLGYGATGYGAYGASGYPTSGYSGEYSGDDSTMAGARRRAQDVASRAGRMVGDARERAGEMASQAREQLSGVSGRMRDQAGDIAERSRHMFQDHPLMLGTMALVVGAAIGASLPRSRAEDRMYGDTRKDLLRSASEAGRETFEKAKRVAARAAEVTRDEGVQALERVREATRDEAERQNLTGGTDSPSRLHH